MAKHTFTKDVVCPYYKYEAPQMVYCEGVGANTSIHLAFDTKSGKKDYMNSKCCDNWKDCQVAQMLNWKYGYS